MERNKISPIRSNSLDITSKFSSFSNLPDIDPNKMKFLRSTLYPLVLHAEKKFHNQSLVTVIENINKADNFDIMKGKETPLKEKALNHLKRSNSVMATNIPYFLEIENNEKEDINKKLIRKKSLRIPNKLNSSNDIFDIFNQDYNMQKYQNFNKTFHIENSIFQNKETFGEGNWSRNNISEKEKIFAEKKNVKMMNIKNMILYNEQLNLRSKPGIDSGSLKIINNKLKDKKPIYERYEEVKNEKKANLEKYKKELIRNNSAKNLNSTNYYDYNLSTKNEKNKIQFNELNLINKDTPISKHFNEWLTKNEKWNNNKENKFKEMKKKMEEQKFENENTSHTPKIDQVSDIIANTKNFNEFPGLEVYDKLYNQKDKKIQKQKYLIEKNKPRFIPTINNYTPKYFHVVKKGQTINKNLNFNEEGKLEYHKSFREINNKTSKDNSYFWRSKKFNNITNKEKKSSEKRKSSTNNAIETNSDKKESFKFSFSFLNNVIKSSSQGKVDDKKANFYKSDLTFFEHNKDNKLIFYNKEIK